MPTHVHNSKFQDQSHVFSKGLVQILVYFIAVPHQYCMQPSPCWLCWFYTENNSMLCWQQELMWLDREIHHFSDIKPVFPIHSTVLHRAVTFPVETILFPWCISPSEKHLFCSTTEVKRNMPQVRLGRKERVHCRDSASRNIARGVKLPLWSFCARETVLHLSLNYHGVLRVEDRLFLNSSSDGLWRRPILWILSLNGVALKKHLLFHT